MKKFSQTENRFKGGGEKIFFIVALDISHPRVHFFEHIEQPKSLFLFLF